MEQTTQLQDLSSTQQMLTECMLLAAHCGKVHPMDFSTKAFRLRAARSDDFRFAWSLYKEVMKPLTEDLLGWWNEPGQKQVVEMALAHEGMQVIESPDTLYLAQLHVAPPSQNRGISGHRAIGIQGENAVGGDRAAQ